MTTMQNLDTIVSQALTHYINPYRAKLNIVYGANAPQTGKAVHKMWMSAINAKAEFVIFNGANDADNLYFSPRTNLLYRTLHDIDHAIQYEQGRGTTALHNERFLNYLMAKRVYRYALRTTDTATALQAFFTMYHDTVGQVDYYAEHRDFCENQRALTEQYLSNCEGMATIKQGDLRQATKIANEYMARCA